MYPKLSSVSERVREFSELYRLFPRLKFLVCSSFSFTLSLFLFFVSPSIYIFNISDSVRGKPHAWDPLICVAEGSNLLQFLHSTISSSPSTLHYQSLFNCPSASSTPSISTNLDETPKKDSSISINALVNWPIFKISFDPREGQIRVQEMGAEQVRADVIAGKKVTKRVGFVLMSWIEGVRLRSEARRRILP